MNYCEVILPLSIPGTFTYKIPESLHGEIERGKRVLVPFGGKKIYTAIVFSLSSTPPEFQGIKEVISALDSEAILSEEALEFWEFLSSYYLIPLGEIYRHAFPSSLKLESETYVKLKPGAEIQFENLDSNEMHLVEALEVRQLISVSEIEAFIPKKELFKTIGSLIDLQYIEIDEKIQEKYRAKEVLYVKTVEGVSEGESLAKSLHELKRSEKQQMLFLELISLQMENGEKPVRKSDLLKDSRFGSSHFKGLLNKGLIEQFTLQEDRLSSFQGDLEDATELTEAQEQASLKITEALSKGKNVLLHGVTGSGKTHLYLEQILKALEKGETTLFLVPEIALSSQMTRRLEKILGEDLGYYHQRLSDFEKVEVWQKVQKGKLKVVVGTRNSLFLPFPSLGLVIIDEEHDNSYRSFSQGLKIQARDSALMLAKFYEAPALLGSATPSVDMYYQALKGKLEWVSLKERYQGVDLPKIELINFKEAIEQKLTEGDFTLQSKAEISHVLEEKNQVMVLHNRRGYAGVLECESCGYVAYCSNCDVVMTYHKAAGELKCHYCGHRAAKPTSCPKCRSENLSTKGVGVEQLHEQVEELFPQAKSERMDVDTMRRKFAYEKLYERLESGETDILVGTQMISKGLDFEKMELVVVPRADHLLYLPDYRVEERAYQLLTQMAGRVGRFSGNGKILIQTYQPTHRLLQFIKEEDKEELYAYLLGERKKFNYPPFTKTILIELRHRKEDKADRASRFLGSILRKYLPENCILGPEKAPIGKINLLYQYQILLKLPRGKKYEEFKNYVTQSLKEFSEVSAYGSIKKEITVDF